jgi:peptidoglycan hydrolase-like protein with peptidoglycan-binding domain
MSRRTAGILGAGTVVALTIGGVLIAIPLGSQTADGQGSAVAAATATVERRTLNALTPVQGTLGYAGTYGIANTLATSGGADRSNAQQTLAAAQSQYDSASNDLHALRNPTATDVAQARAQVKQAAASVTQARGSLAYDLAALKSAKAALADCEASASASPSPAPSAESCDTDTLKLQITQTKGAIATDRAQLAAAQAGLNAARTALYALQHPTADQIRKAEQALATAKTQLEAARGALDLPRGVLTQLAEVGSIVQPGEALYTLDRTHPVVLLKGDVPSWRQFESGMSDGPDVQQLEANLRDMDFGSSALKVDRHWDAQTAAAVKRWQHALGLARSGVVPLGEVVFEPGPLRVTANSLSLGATVQAGTAVLEATSTKPVVSVALDPGLQTKVKEGDPVSVVMPNGSMEAGTVSHVGTVATTADSSADSTPTIAVTVTLDDRSAAGGLDQAPVSVNITTDTATDVLAVPVGALVLTLDGVYAVQVEEAGERQYVAVELGLFAGGMVEVSGSGLSEGQTVVVAK